MYAYVGTVIGLRAGTTPGFESRQRQGIFMFAETSWLAQGPTQSPVHRVSGLFLWSRPGRNYLHLALRLRMSAATSVFTLYDHIADRDTVLYTVQVTVLWCVISFHL